MGWSGENLMMLQDKLFVKWGRREISRSGDFPGGCREPIITGRVSHHLKFKKSDDTESTRFIIQHLVNQSRFQLCALPLPMRMGFLYGQPLRLFEI